jgi:hypothetical protein
VTVGIVLIYFPLRKLWNSREELPVDGTGDDVVGDAAIDLAELPESGKSRTEQADEPTIEEIP